MEKIFNELNSYLLSLKKQGTNKIPLSIENIKFIKNSQTIKEEPEPLTMKKTENIKEEKLDFYQFNKDSSYCFLIDFSKEKKEEFFEHQYPLLQKIILAGKINDKETNIILMDKNRKNSPLLAKQLEILFSKLSSLKKIFIMGNFSRGIIFPEALSSNINFSIKEKDGKKILISPSLESFFRYEEQKVHNMKKILWQLMQKFCL